METRCSNCGEPSEPILIHLTTSNGTTIASFNAEDSMMLLDTALHLLIDTLVVPAARRTAAAHGEPK